MSIYPYDLRKIEPGVVVFDSVGLESSSHKIIGLENSLHNLNTQGQKEDKLKCQREKDYL